MKNVWMIILGAISCVILTTFIFACLVGGIAAYFIYATRDNPVSEVTYPVYSTTTTTPEPRTTPSPEVENPDSPPAVQTAIPTDSVLPTTSATAVVSPPTAVLTDTLVILENEIVPINDPIELAERFEGKENLPRNLEFPVEQYQVGDRKPFWVTDTDTNQNSQTQAVLRYATNHVYFWVEEGVSYRERALEALVDTFENEIYPTNREFFGSEWTPGVDAEPRLYILYTTGMGGSVAGYFSSVDEYLPAVREDSNGHEMFLLSADHIDLEEEYAYGVLAHEFQHMIHWYRDRNEDTWMNEGFSDLAMLLNGYSIGGHDSVFANDPDIQLNDWPDNPNETTAHYGASFLFMAYFLDRFGEGATQALVSDPANGMVSIDEVLAGLGATDPLTGEGIGADDVFADWVVATYLQNASVSDGRYTYHNYPQAPSLSDTESIRDCPLETGPRDVSQYGADYLRITCSGEYRLHFEGSTQVDVLPADPYSGSYAYYSNSGDESDMTLTRTFDFTGQSGPLTLSYWTWYDLEEDYDYLYLTASLDGENWQILTTPSGTAEDPSGNSYGWAYNGASGGGPEWIQESVDISQFAGQQVQIRFEYITDAAVNGEGFLLDDVAVPEIGYFSDFETDEGGWEADGFVRIQNVLPQTFELTLIHLGDETTVERITIAADNTADIPIQIGGDVEAVVVVVSGTTRFTRQKALYQLSIQR